MQPMNVILKVKEEKEDDLLAIPGVTGVDVGKKITKGVKTDEVAIRVYVKKKKDKVPESEMIPKEIEGVKTDVIECEFKLHTEAVALADLERRADTATYATLVGGVSIGPCTAVGGYVYTGTLGCMVRDGTSNEIYMLSNYHVMAEKWAAGEALCQPSRVDTGSCPSDVVGHLVRSVISQNVDAAVASISGRPYDCSIHEIGDVKGKATAVTDMAVRKRGRTTGLTYGTVSSTTATVSVPYDHGDQILKNQILIEVDTAQSTQFGNSGDSGSAVVDDNNKVVGLYFAGNDAGSIGVANPIDAVLSELNIELCVKVTGPFKSIYEENYKWLGEVFWKNRYKEVAYEKPPSAEYWDWFDNWVINPPIFGGRSQPGAATAQAGFQFQPPDAIKKIEKPEFKEFKEKDKEWKEWKEWKEKEKEKDFKEWKEIFENNKLREVMPNSGQPGPGFTDAAGFQFQPPDAIKKIEKPEFKEFKEKDRKEFKEFKEFKEKEKDLKERKEIYEGGYGFAGFNQSGWPDGSRGGPQAGLQFQSPDMLKKIEKPELKEFKEKDIKEWKEVKEKERKEFKEWKEVKDKEKEKDFKEWKEVFEGGDKLTDAQTPFDPRQQAGGFDPSGANMQFQQPLFKKVEKPELKEFKEKDRKEFKEFKEWKEKEKEFKEWKEKEKEFKEWKERKEIFEGGDKLQEVQNPLDPRVPAGNNPAAAYPGAAAGAGYAAPSMEERLARIEAALSQSHFINPELRPDLQGGALTGEPDYKKRR